MTQQHKLTKKHDRQEKQNHKLKIKLTKEEAQQPIRNRKQETGKQENAKIRKL